MITCKFCNKETETIHHQIRCPLNPNRKGVTKWLEIWSPEEKEKHSQTSKRTNAEYWTEEKKKEQSDRMQQVVALNPESYSKNNVSGRVKMYEVISSTGATKVKGRWELAVADYLNENNIKWTNSIAPYSYFWNNKWHLYFPDFLLTEINVVIEVKGFQTERDFCKWEAVTDRNLIVIKKEQINDLGNVFKNMASNANGEQEVS